MDKLRIMELNEIGRIKEEAEEKRQQEWAEMQEILANMEKN